MSLEKMELINRELSWLEFNQRVLDEAIDSRVPLLERLKFLAITSSNLDEFFMVRVGGLSILLKEGVTTTDPRGMTPLKQLETISSRVRRMVTAQYNCFHRSLIPQLNRAGIELLIGDTCTTEQENYAKQYFNDELLPVLSPMAIDEAEPFPLLRNMGLNLAVRLKDTTKPGGKNWKCAIVPIPPNLDRLVRMPSPTHASFMPIGRIIQRHINQLFYGEEILETSVFRITRNADMRVREDLAPDLMSGMEAILLQRKFSQCVRLEIDRRATPVLLAFLKSTLKIPDRSIYKINGFLDLACMMRLASIDGFDEHKYETREPLPSPDLDVKLDIMDQIAKRDILLCHPYEAYDPVIKLVEDAARDPQVLAIKQILYRTSRNSPIIRALKHAAEQGKYVTVVVELKARFDEARNIEWAKELEYAGVQVIYGVKNLKTHAKLCLIVRREPQGVVRYVHFGTGNYNEKTARLYSDISYMTCKDEYGFDASSFMNAITGYSQPRPLLKLASAPFDLRDRILDLIEGEIERKKQGQKAHIMAKMNALVDPAIIRALYRASHAGVKIQLNVRGICCLRPGVKGLSTNITVTSIVDRYLEHSRIFYFLHGGEKNLFIASADWMPRNLDRRVELLIPVEDPDCHAKLLNLLYACLRDNVKSRRILGDGTFQKPPRLRSNLFRCQDRLYLQLKDALEKANQLKRSELEPQKPFGDT
ncbi:MAG: polyphosphate kinase 1 [Kiritimatiellae bacterium]|nr:polyphosphate kinase 1 [Kiritimatiellia bacterium]MDD4736278.1 polyphosphate kinase 1 [Kiritimatiellia bacterium]